MSFLSEAMSFLDIFILSFSEVSVMRGYDLNMSLEDTSAASETYYCLFYPNKLIFLLVSGLF